MLLVSWENCVLTIDRAALKVTAAPRVVGIDDEPLLRVDIGCPTSADASMIGQVPPPPSMTGADVSPITALPIIPLLGSTPSWTALVRAPSRKHWLVLR